MFVRCHNYGGFNNMFARCYSCGGIYRMFGFQVVITTQQVFAEWFKVEIEFFTVLPNID